MEAALTAPPPRETTTLDRPNRIPWPPLLYALVAIAAYGLERWVPLPVWPDIAGLRWAGGAVALGGIGLAGVALAAFRSVGTTFDPTGPAAALAERGIYAWSRNPMYVGGVALFLGLALALRSSWLLVAVPLLAVALTRLAILPEEAYLLRRFGDDYRAYVARTRRWI